MWNNFPLSLILFWGQKNPVQIGIFVTFTPCRTQLQARLPPNSFIPNPAKVDDYQILTNNARKKAEGVQAGEEKNGKQGSRSGICTDDDKWQVIWW